MSDEVVIEGTTEDFFLYELDLLKNTVCSVLSKLRELRDIAHKNSVGQLQLYESLRNRVGALEEENGDLRLLLVKEKLNG